MQAQLQDAEKSTKTGLITCLGGLESSEILGEGVETLFLSADRG